MSTIYQIPDLSSRILDRSSFSYGTEIIHKINNDKNMFLIAHIRYLLRCTGPDTVNLNSKFLQHFDTGT
jgi:hypothetical protein